MWRRRLLDGWRSQQQASHDQNRYERNEHGIDILRPRHADAERKPDSRYADWIEQLAAERNRDYQRHRDECHNAHGSGAGNTSAEHDK